MQQINLTGNIDRAEGEKLFFIIEKKEKKKHTHTHRKKTVLDFSKATVKVF